GGVGAGGQRLRDEEVGAEAADEVALEVKAHLRAGVFDLRLHGGGELRADVGEHLLQRGVGGAQVELVGGDAEPLGGGPRGAHGGDSGDGGGAAGLGGGAGVGVDEHAGVVGGLDAEALGLRGGLGGELLDDGGVVAQLDGDEHGRRGGRLAGGEVGENGRGHG